jgi:hypothetical protein
VPRASRYTPEIVQDIFDRLAAGETIAAICAIERMPALSTFRYWRRTRRDFDQNIAALLARRKLRWPVQRRRSLCTPELTARIAAQLQTGRTLYAICRDDPELPTYACVHRWLKDRPDFARAVAAAMPWTRVRRPKRGRPSEWSEPLGKALCARIAAGEPLLRICEDPAMPGRRTVQRWLRTHRASAASTPRRACSNTTCFWTMASA